MTMEHFTSKPTSSWWTAFANDLAPMVYENIRCLLTEPYAVFGYVNHKLEISAVDQVVIRGIRAVAMYIAAGKIKGECRVL